MDSITKEEYNREKTLLQHRKHLLNRRIVINTS